MANQVHYFTRNGEYGDASEMAFIETAEWTQDDFDLVIDADTELSMPTRAHAVAAYVRLGRPAEFFVGDPVDFQISAEYLKQLMKQDRLA